LECCAESFLGKDVYFRCGGYRAFAETVNELQQEKRIACIKSRGENTAKTPFLCNYYRITAQKKEMIKF